MIIVPKFPWLARKMWLAGSWTPIENRAAMARLTTRPISTGLSGECQREIVNTPSGFRADRKTFHASAVYSPFSDNENAPAPVAANESIIVI